MADRVRNPTTDSSGLRGDVSPLDVIDLFQTQSDIADFAPTAKAGLDAGQGVASVYGAPLSLMAIINTTPTDVDILDTDGSLSIDTTVVNTADASVKHTPSGTRTVHTVTFAEEPLPENSSATVLSLTGSFRWHRVADSCTFEALITFYDASHTVIDGAISAATVTVDASTSDTWKQMTAVFQIPVAAVSFVVSVEGFKPSSSLLQVTEVSYYNDFQATFPSIYSGVHVGMLNPGSQGILGYRQRYEEATYSAIKTVAVVNTDTLWGTTTMTLTPIEKDGASIRQNVVAKFSCRVIGVTDVTACNASVRVDISTDGGSTWNNGTYHLCQTADGVSDAGGTIHCMNGTDGGVWPTGDIQARVMIQQSTGHQVGDSRFDLGCLVIQTTPCSPF